MLKPTSYSNDKYKDFLLFNRVRSFCLRRKNNDKLHSRYFKSRKFITESGEVIDNLRLRYEHVGYHGQPLVVVCHALTGNHLTYGTDDYPGWWRELLMGIYTHSRLSIFNI